MSFTAKLRRAPLRISTGAYILNSGLGKFGADDETSKHLHAAAVATIPAFGKLDAKVFAKGLAAAEVALGGALLLPIVPVGVAGVGLAAFSGAMLTMYWKTPGMHAEGSIRPTVQGTPIAKDVWMAGIAAGLLVDAVTSPAHDKAVEVSATVSEKAASRKRQSRKSRKAAKKDRKETIEQAKAMATAARAAAKLAAAQAKSQAKDLPAAARTSARDAAAQAKELADQAKAAAREASAKTSVRARDLAGAAKVGSKAAEKAA
jgi:hypothetical protein